MTYWIFQTGEPIHSDEQNSRPMRAMNLADTLLERGHDVVLFSAQFNHQRKQPRIVNKRLIHFSDKLQIILIPSIGYHSNIGLRRIIDHAELALRLRFILKRLNFPRPKAVFIGYPPIEAAFILASWCKKRQIPYIVDPKDMWPDIFLRASPRAIRPLLNICLFPYYRMAKVVFKNSSSIIGITQEFLQWAQSVNPSRCIGSDLVAPLSVRSRIFALNELQQASSWWLQQGVDVSSEERFCFIGTFSGVFNFSPLLKVASDLLIEDPSWQIVLCGSGQFYNEVKQRSMSISNIIMPGYINHSQSSVLMQASRAFIAPYISNIIDYEMSIPNKFIDCFSAGLPIISTLKGVCKKLIEANDIGINCDNNQESLAASIGWSIHNKSKLTIMREQSRKLYQEEFEFSKVYNKIATKLETL